MQNREWICPKCGRRLTIENQEHVCGLYDLEAHFSGKDPLGKAAYDFIWDTLEPLGEFDVLPMKTMIMFAYGTNLASIRTRRVGVEISIFLPLATVSHRFTDRSPYSKHKVICRVFVASPTELDEELGEWLRESYRLWAKLPKN